MFTVNEIVNKKPYLTYFPNDVVGVEENIRELNDGYRLFYNHRNKRYEVHNLNNQGSSMCLVAEKCDARIVKRIYKSYVPYHGDEVETMEEHNKKIDAKEAKRQEDTMDDMKKDLERPIAKALEKDEIGKGYNGFHVMPKLKEGEKDDSNRD